MKISSVSIVKEELVGNFTTSYFPKLPVKLQLPKLPFSSKIIIITSKIENWLGRDKLSIIWLPADDIAFFFQILVQ